MYKYVLISPLMIMLVSCAQMIPGLTQAIDDAVTDQAISVEVDKAAIQKDQNIKINLEITQME